MDAETGEKEGLYLKYLCKSTLSSAESFQPVSLLDLLLTNESSFSIRMSGGKKKKRS